MFVFIRESLRFANTFEVGFEDKTVVDLEVGDPAYLRSLIFAIPHFKVPHICYPAYLLSCMPHI